MLNWIAIKQTKDDTHKPDAACAQKRMRVVQTEQPRAHKFTTTMMSEIASMQKCKCMQNCK